MYMNMRRQLPSPLKLSRTYFHLSFHHRSPVIFPIEPVNPSTRSLTCIEVLTVEVGAVTVSVPPSTFVLRSTVATRYIIVSVFGGELVSAVRT